MAAPPPPLAQAILKEKRRLYAQQILLLDEMQRVSSIDSSKEVFSVPPLLLLPQSNGDSC